MGANKIYNSFMDTLKLDLNNMAIESVIKMAISHTLVEVNEGNRVMDLNEYQESCFRTWDFDKTHKDQFVASVMNASMGLSGESGEVTDLVKKWNFQGHALYVDDVAVELGDILYYVAVMAHTLNYTLEQIASININKLKKRYPQGFSKERSIKRDE